MGNSNSEIKKFLDEECILYKLDISGTTVYLLLLNVNQTFVKEIIKEFYDRIEDNLKFDKYSKKTSELIFSFQDLNERFSNGLHLPSDIDQEIIREISQNHSKDKYHLVYQNGEFLIKSLESEDESSQIILGVFLNEKETFSDLLNSGEGLRLNEFNEELVGKVSGLFYYEEEIDKVKQERDQDYYKKVKRQDEENFDKEFDYVEESADEGEQPQKPNKQRRYHHEDTENIARSSPVKKKRKRKQIDESEFLDDVTVFMAKMREAIELDKKSYKEDRVALEKLKMLSKIDKFLGNIYFQRTFLQSEGLILLEDWIKRYPDGTFPPLNQISSMLDTLSNLSLSLPYLRQCNIGGHIMELSKNPKIPKHIQKKARDIVEKWSRIVFDINTNYSDIDSENRTYESIYKKRRRTDDDEEGSDEEKEDQKQSLSASKKDPNDLYSHARIPKKALFDFTHKPISNISDSKLDLGVRIRYNFFEKRNKGGRKKE